MYFRIDNIFRCGVVVSVGLNDGPVLLHRGNNRCILHPNHHHRFSIQWHQQGCKLFIDQQCACAATYRQGVANSVAPLASLFVWVHLRAGLECGGVCLEPIPSPILLTSQLTCVLCDRERNLAPGAFCTCPCCDAWICSHHCLSSPARCCPRCAKSLMYYVGIALQRHFTVET